MSDHCRSCGAEILWARTERGKEIPLDPQPIRMGNMRLDESLLPGELPTAVHEESDDYSYLPHFATCPHAESWRRR